MPSNEKTYNSNLRREHFVSAVKKRFRSTKKCVPFDVICAAVATQPAPQFYVTTERALIMYQTYKRTGCIHTKTPLIRQMYEEIFRRFEEKLQSRGGRAFKFVAMQDTLSEQAPCFYIAPEKAQFYYYHSMAFCRKYKAQKK